MAKASEAHIGTTQAGKVLGLTARQVLNLIKDGILPAERIGRTYIIRPSDLSKVPEDRKPGPKPKERKR